MTKCVACDPQHVAGVLAMFDRLRQATLSKFMPTTHIYTIHLIPQDTEARKMAMMKAALAQQLYIDGSTRVVIMGLDGVDPFTFRPTGTTPDGAPIDSTLVEQIYHGSVINASGNEISNPIMKVGRSCIG